MFGNRLMLILAALAVAAAVAIFLIGSPYGGNQTAMTSRSESDVSGQRIEVDLTEWSLGFQELTVPANQQLTFVVRNSGTIAHGFEIEGEVDGEEKEWVVEPFQPGQTKTLTVTLPPGEYEAYCQVPGHEEEGMAGVVIARTD